jgi:hypothetical protein
MITIPLWSLVFIAIPVIILLAYLAWKVYDKLDDTSDSLQRQLFPIADFFSEAQASWIKKVIIDLVIGDEESFAGDLAVMLYAKDKELFFFDEIAVPCAKYAVRMGLEKYPDKLGSIIDILNKNGKLKP